jgi:hypothetical protein
MPKILDRVVCRRPTGQAGGPAPSGGSELGRRYRRTPYGRGVAAIGHVGGNLLPARAPRSACLCAAIACARRRDPASDAVGALTAEQSWGTGGSGWPVIAIKV